jgi:hypothetical protein
MVLNVRFGQILGTTNGMIIKMYLKKWSVNLQVGLN